MACLEKILADGDADGAAERVEAFDVGQLFAAINGKHRPRSALTVHDAATRCTAIRKLCSEQDRDRAYV